MADAAPLISAATWAEHYRKRLLLQHRRGVPLDVERIKALAADASPVSIATLRELTEAAERDGDRLKAARVMAARTPEQIKRQAAAPVQALITGFNAPVNVARLRSGRVLLWTLREPGRVHARRSVGRRPQSPRRTRQSSRPASSRAGPARPRDADPPLDEERP